MVQYTIFSKWKVVATPFSDNRGPSRKSPNYSTVYQTKAVLFGS